MVVVAEAEVVRRAQNGDRAAFAQLYETYLPKIHDFVLGMTRNRADAEDITSDTFLKAVERLRGLKEPEAFKGWLYTIARNSALNLVETRKRTVPTADHDEYAVTLDAPVLPDPSSRAEDDEIRDLLWDAAATLNPRDYQVFELTVRHGMTSAEVAEVLGVRTAYAYILVNRLKDSVAEALETVMLTRTGRMHCAELDRIVSVYGSDGGPRMRKAVARHAKDCAACDETKKTKASVPLMLAGLAFAAPSAAFASELSGKIDHAWQSAFGPGSGTGTSAGAGASGGLASLAGVIATVFLLTTTALGLSAQRTIVPVEKIEKAASSHAVASPTPSPTPIETPEPDRTQRPTFTSAPQPTAIIIVGPGAIITPTPHPEDTLPPKQTEPPKTPPPRTRPPVG